MVDINDEDDEFVILNIAHDPVGANAIAPEVTELGSLQGFTLFARIAQDDHPLFKV